MLRGLLPRSTLMGAIDLIEDIHHIGALAPGAIGYCTYQPTSLQGEHGRISAQFSLSQLQNACHTRRARTDDHDVHLLLVYCFIFWYQFV